MEIVLLSHIRCRTLKYSAYSKVEEGWEFFQFVCYLLPSQTVSEMVVRFTLPCTELKNDRQETRKCGS